ncbi:hypothetical protein OTK49_02830 [Vibrio coralliirubri]|uniref:hypothetical protein n=1 Tax=Vibrio coralliirubri TaxID=1516159 RepID=UPI00228465D8|nr:hypothetical protein [Vibrio coralliirubri]MCY9861453.1 hypothetical protein [Vibrio coralliirubri]
MAHSLCHKSLKHANATIAQLAAASPFKLSRFREVHAQALNFNSYNSLVATLKSKPVFFSEIAYLESLESIVKTKFGYDCEQNIDEWAKFQDLVFSIYDSEDGWLSVRVARLDFKVLHIPAEGFSFDTLTRLPACYDGNSFIDINDFLKTVVPDSKNHSVSWAKTARAIQNNHTWSEKEEIENQSGISLVDPEYKNQNAVFYFTTSTGGYADAGDDYFSKVLTTGYGSLLLIVDTDTEVTITDQQKQLLVGLCGDPLSSHPLSAPVVSFLGGTKFFDVQFPPTDDDGHICNEIDTSDFEQYEPLAYLPTLTTKDALCEYFEPTAYEGNYIVPINENVEVDPNLVHAWRLGLSVVVDQNCTVNVNRPSGAHSFIVFGWDMAMEIDGVHSMIEEAYRQSESYADFTIQNTTCNQFSSCGTIHFSEQTYADIFNIDCADPKIKALCEDTVVDEVCDKLISIDSLDGFADFLKSIGVTTLVYTEQLEHLRGDAFASVWIGYDDAMNEMLAFEMHSFERSLADICESIRVLMELPLEDCGVHRSMEFSISTRNYEADPDWRSNYYSILKPFDPELLNMR